MKKLISFLLCVVLLAALSLPGASAAGKFDKSVFQNSTKYTQDSFSDWNLQGHYIKQYSNARIMIYSLLFSNYVDEGWGPELRVYYYDPATRENFQVTGFRADINGTKYCFDNLGWGNNGAGYVFGGTVQDAFFKALLNVKTASFEFEYIDLAGNHMTGWDTHIHTGELSDLIDMGKYLIKSNAFSIDPNPKSSDSDYSASIK